MTDNDKIQLKSKYLSKIVYIFLWLIIVLVVIGIVYMLQQRKVNNLNKTNSSLNHKLSILNNKYDQLKEQNMSTLKHLSEANQAISQLYSNNTFVSGQQCQPEQLTLETNGYQSQSTKNNTYALFSYQNNSSTVCILDGYPGFLALNSSGYVIPDGPVLDVNYPNNSKPSIVTLNPGSKAYFQVHWSDIQSSPNQKCFTATIIESTPPGDSYPLILTTNYPVCSNSLNVSEVAPLSTFQGQ